jgi:hypothetical protein
MVAQRESKCLIAGNVCDIVTTLKLSDEDSNCDELQVLK